MTALLDRLRPVGYVPMREDPELSRALTGSALGLVGSSIVHGMHPGLATQLLFLLGIWQAVAMAWLVGTQLLVEQSLERGLANLHGVYDLMAPHPWGWCAVYVGQSVDPVARERQHLDDGNAGAYIYQGGRWRPNRKALWAGQVTMRVVRLLPTAGSKDRYEARRIWALSWLARSCRLLGMPRACHNIDCTVTRTRLGRLGYLYRLAYTVWLCWLGLLWPRRFSFGLLNPFHGPDEFRPTMPTDLDTQVADQPVQWALPVGGKS
jgi:hypothetical protein